MPSYHQNFGAAQWQKRCWPTHAYANTHQTNEHKNQLENQKGGLYLWDEIQPPCCHGSKNFILLQNQKLGAVQQQKWLKTRIHHNTNTHQTNEQNNQLQKKKEGLDLLEIQPPCCHGSKLNILFQYQIVGTAPWQKWYWHHTCQWKKISPVNKWTQHSIWKSKWRFVSAGRDPASMLPWIQK